MELEEVDLDAPLAELGRNLLVETEAGRTILKRSGTGKSKRFDVDAFLPDGLKRQLREVPKERSLRQTAASLSAARPLRAYKLPKGPVESRHRPLPTLAAALPMAAAGTLLASGFIFDDLGPLRVLMLIVGIVVLVVGADALKKSQRFKDWGVRPRGGELLVASSFELPPPAEEIEVDDVKVEYGRLLSDLVYRIENPALFDPQEPTSRAFTLALLQWDNNDGVVPDDERRALAARVRFTFAAARANAERLGLSYLPEGYRAKAGTALKAARLATNPAAPEPEREAALRRAVEILDDLALFFLPSGAEARKAITGRAPLQLPGRRSA